MARIKGAVFKTLRPRSIYMHLEARRLYKCQKGKKVDKELPMKKEEMNRDAGFGHKKWLEALDELEKQLLGYRKIVLHSQTGRSDASISYTGKSQGAQDDLVVTLTIAAYWGVQFMTRRITGLPYDILDGSPSERH